MLPRALLSGLSDFVGARLGLHFPEERWNDLQRGLAAVAPEFGFDDAQSCAWWLLSTRQERSHVEVLGRHLTIGETYFFREKAALDALREYILPELLRRQGECGRSLRIWSAGCCTGEEAYSIAMLLDGLIPDGVPWNVTVRATDVNPDFLRKAAAGIYSEWSFRGTPAWIKERYFRRCRDGRLVLHPRIRMRIAFSCLNLAADAYPSLPSDTCAMDVILCRNVLMYFNVETARKVVDNFHRSLAEGGWLIVGAAETSNGLFSSFTPVGFADALVYRKLDPAAKPEAQAIFPQVMAAPATAPEPADAAMPVPAFAASATATFAPSSPSSETPAPSASVPSRVPASPRDAAAGAFLTARRCADQGRLAEAVAWCEKAIAADKLNPAHYYLLASIEQERGRTEAAMRSLLRALYVDADFVLARFALGNIELAQGRRREGERHISAVLAMLRSHADDEILPESAGLTAGRLTEIASAVLAGLPREPEGAAP